jgi:myo-inositol-1(or 4)-monophosphatase
MLSFGERVAVSRDELNAYKAFALDISVRAGKATLPYFRNSVAIDDKRSGGRYDPVTEADREAEQIVRAGLAVSFPDHGIFGEEYGLQAGNGLTWVIDPIDGTRAFMTGMLHWGLLLALFDGQQPILGVMHQPFTGELFYGDNREAHYRQGSRSRRLQTRRGVAVREAVLTTTSPKLFDRTGERAEFDRLERAVKLSKYGGDCYIYAMLAMGYVDLATDAGLQAYDIQALMPIIRGAGGVVTTIDGGDASLGGSVIASGSAELHAEALACMAGRETSAWTSE